MKFITEVARNHYNIRQKNSDTTPLSVQHSTDESQVANI